MEGSHRRQLLLRTSSKERKDVKQRLFQAITKPTLFSSSSSSDSLDSSEEFFLAVLVAAVVDSATVVVVVDSEVASWVVEGDVAAAVLSRDGDEAEVVGGKVTSDAEVTSIGPAVITGVLDSDAGVTSTGPAVKSTAAFTSGVVGSSTLTITDTDDSVFGAWNGSELKVGAGTARVVVSFKASVTTALCSSPLAALFNFTMSKYSCMFFDGVTMKTSCLGACVDSSSSADLLTTFLSALAGWEKGI